eukprot:Nitzschia sp. Nitz4//scaffold220_size35126//15792//17657//NITZ4_007832-RA/size35126-processed-gene-0.4-mRNA-1//1//CDS//3329542535//6409//frame0
MKKLHQQQEGSATIQVRFLQTVFLLLGVGVLLPWNAFISAKPYFQARLCRLSASPAAQNDWLIGSFDVQDLEAWLSILYNGASAVSLAIVILVQFLYDGSATGGTPTNSRQKAKGDNSLHTTWYLVNIPLALYLTVFVCTTLLVLLPDHDSSSEDDVNDDDDDTMQILMFYGTWIGFGLCGVCTSMATAGIVGAAGEWSNPNIGIHPFFHGQAVGGVIVALGNFWASYANPHAEETFWVAVCHVEPFAMNTDISLQSTTTTTTATSTAPNAGTTVAQEISTTTTTTCVGYTHISWPTAIYFGVSCMVLLACMVGFYYVDQQKPSRGDHIGNDEGDGDETILYNETLQLLSDPQGIHPVKSSTSWQYQATMSMGESSTSSDSLVDPESVPSSPSIQMMNKGLAFPRSSSIMSSIRNSTTWAIWKAVQGPTVALFWTYFVTLLIFPVWTSKLSSSHGCHHASGRLQNDLFSPFSFVVFNAGDLLGRYLSSSLTPMEVNTDTDGVISTVAMSNRLVVVSLLRVAFFPVFGLLLLAQEGSTAGEADAWTWLPTMLGDFPSWMFQAIFAISNGWITNAAFSFAPSLIENDAYPQQVASAILNFSLCLGLLCGSLCSLPLLHWIGVG